MFKIGMSQDVVGKSIDNQYKAIPTSIIIIAITIRDVFCKYGIPSRLGKTLRKCPLDTTVISIIGISCQAQEHQRNGRIKESKKTKQQNVWTDKLSHTNASPKVPVDIQHSAKDKIIQVCFIPRNNSGIVQAFRPSMILRRQAK